MFFFFTFFILFHVDMLRYGAISHHCQSQTTDPVRLTQLNVMDCGCLILTGFTVMRDLHRNSSSLYHLRQAKKVFKPAEFSNHKVYIRKILTSIKFTPTEFLSKISTRAESPSNSILVNTTRAMTGLDDHTDHYLI